MYCTRLISSWRSMTCGTLRQCNVGSKSGGGQQYLVPNATRQFSVSRLDRYAVLSLISLTDANGGGAHGAAHPLCSITITRKSHSLANPTKLPIHGKDSSRGLRSITRFPNPDSLAVPGIPQENLHVKPRKSKERPPPFSIFH